MLLVSDQEVLSSSLTQYNDYMKTAPRSSSAKQAAMVKRVGQKIAQATEAYLRQNGLAAEVKNFQWEFNLVADKQVNAFCMPGGKIVVYEGLMKLVTSDDELAVVIGHEVAHAVAKHSNERLSQQMLAQTGAQLLKLAYNGPPSRRPPPPSTDWARRWASCCPSRASTRRRPTTWAWC